MSKDVLRNEIFATKTQAEIAKHLGLKREAVTAIKAGRRGLSPDASRRLGALIGEKPAEVYLASQVTSLKRKVATKTITPQGVMTSCQHIVKALKGNFRGDEINRKDPKFRQAAEQLKEIAEAALDLADAGDESMGPAAGSPNDQGPIYVTGDSVAPALKSRDAHGKAMKDQGAPVQRDGYGRRIN